MDVKGDGVKKFAEVRKSVPGVIYKYQFWYSERKIVEADYKTKALF